MKETTAQTWIQVTTECPYCDSYEDIFEDESIKEAMGHDVRAEDIEVEVTCKECEKTFIITEIIY